MAIAFTIITALHIVLGELAPKSLALQKSETTALAVVRPLSAFLFLLRPAIVTLNGLGNLVLRLFGLRPGAAEESLHSPEELKLLIAESQEAGLLRQEQQEVVARVLSIGDRPIGDIMTPRIDVEWIDIEDDAELVGDLDVETFPTIVVCDAQQVRFAGPVAPQPETLLRLLRSLLVHAAPGTRWPVADDEAEAFAARLRQRD